MNNEIFWDEYNKSIKEKINRLIKTKETIYVDLHIHSNYSTDGKRSLHEIIKTAEEYGFDIISITDHDCVEAYNELYEIINNEKLSVIIIPGIEFTVDCKEYGSQCHILQYYINPKSNKLLTDVEKNEKAGWIRAEKQLKRLQENKAMNYFKELYNLNFNIDDYKKFLNESKLYVPEYATMMEYIKQKILSVNVTVLDLWRKLEEENEKDLCLERKQKKKEKYEYLQNKYNDKKDCETSTRLLLSILAVKGDDDDFYSKYESSGSLSVNNYEQIMIGELNNEFFTVFAHPNYECFNVIKNIELYNKNIDGFEKNYRSYYNEEQLKEFNKIAESKNKVITLGSDMHAFVEEYYSNLNFYIISKVDLNKMNDWKKKC